MKTKDLTLVIPVYNEEESIPELLEWIYRVVDTHHISTEVLMIDDGSTDDSWKIIQACAKQDARLLGLRFKRNYGKSAALQTGFNQAVGEVVITMDADMQDSPNEIPQLMAMIKEENLDIVSGWKKKRHDPLIKTIPSKFFNYVTSLVSGIKINDFNCGLKAYKNDVVKNIHVYGEMHRYIPLIAKWNGFNRIGEKKVLHQARKYGTTKYGTKRFITGFLDLLSILFVSKFKKNPMHFFGVFGILSIIIGFFITVWIIGDKLYRQHYLMPIRDIVDQPLFFLALVALIVGTQLFLAGFIAEMIIGVNLKKEDYIISDKTDSGD